MKTYYVTFGSGDVRNNFGLTPTFLIFSQNGSGVTPPSIAAVTGATGFYSFQYGTTTPIAFLIDGFTSGLSASDRYVKGAIDPADRADEYGTTLTALGLTGIALGTTNVALGTTSVALGTTNVALGTTAVSFWSSSGASLQALGTTGVALGVTNVAIGTTLTAMSTTLLAQGLTLLGIPTLIGSVGSTFGGVGSDPIDLFGYMKRVQENLEGNNVFTKVSGALQIYSRGSSQLLITKTIANSASTVVKS